MTPERAEQMLQEYKPFLGRCNYLRTAISLIELDLAKKREGLAADLATNSASPPDGMPRGSKVGNPTERLGMMLAGGYETEDMQSLQELKHSYETELAEKSITVVLVQGWLEGLPMKQRWMIERQIFDCMTYAEINPLYRQTFEESCSKDTLRRLRKDALASVHKMAE